MEFSILCHGIKTEMVYKAWKEKSKTVAQSCSHLRAQVCVYNHNKSLSLKCNIGSLPLNSFKRTNIFTGALTLHCIVYLSVTCS
jgi:hypothetical protein